MFLSVCDSGKCTKEYWFYYSHKKPLSEISMLQLNTEPSIFRGSALLSRYSYQLRARRFRDQIPLVARFFAPVQTSPGAHPIYREWIPGYFPEVNWPGRRLNHSSLSSSKVKEIVELYLYSPSRSSWPVIGRTVPFYPSIVPIFFVPYIAIPTHTGSGRSVCHDTGCAVTKKKKASNIYTGQIVNLTRRVTWGPT